jgi:hypothetical protein
MDTHPRRPARREAPPANPPPRGAPPSIPARLDAAPSIAEPGQRFALPLPASTPVFTQKS